jgi:hypothetical protein
MIHLKLNAVFKQVATIFQYRVTQYYKNVDKGRTKHIGGPHASRGPQVKNLETLHVGDNCREPAMKRNEF